MNNKNVDLINAVIENKERISYINLDERNKYRGWIDDFNIMLVSGEKMRLDLSRKEDLFLLFILASSWSKTGPWENAAYFVTYLKVNQLDKVEYWLSDENIEKEINKRTDSAKRTVEQNNGVVPRRKISFRKDYYNSVQVLAKEWNEIINKLDESNKCNDYMLFINYLRSIKGLGTGKNKMRIKIPLILRELRCQNFYSNIPGEYCCVPDERVKKASSVLGIKLSVINNIRSLLKASGIIYKNFGDLYDIPLFAYEDLVEQLS